VHRIPTRLPRLCRHSGTTALRLEALAHPSMKGKGPGRAENGNFALGRIRSAPKKRLAGVRFGRVQRSARAFAESRAEQGLLEASLHRVDEEPRVRLGRWTGQSRRKDHAAVFVYRSTADPPTRSTLTMKLASP
jgi:hypothetical protein